MSEATTTGDIDPNSVRKTVSVQAPAAVAWRVFTEQMGSWWPLGNYKIGKAKAVDAIIEPRVGGRWYERGEDGSTCQWGTVLAWEPQTRLVLSWDITAEWQYDPNLKTEIELRFIPEGKNTTRIELEHRRLDRFGARRDEMRRIFETEGDWGRVLQMFARAAAGEGRDRCRTSKRPATRSLHEASKATGWRRKPSGGRRSTT
jgi:uncharacterized protein YndB with AHSA1/START domain